MQNKGVVQQKSFQFAVRIVKLTKFLQQEKHEYILSKQLLRSGTSIGANINEAEYSISKKDFNMKMYISYKECGETAYWLKLLYETNYLSKEQYQSISKDCIEIQKILTAITKNDEKKSGRMRSDLYKKVPPIDFRAAHHHFSLLTSHF